MNFAGFFNDMGGGAPGGTRGGAGDIDNKKYYEYLGVS
jgi:hypothetical protein